MLAVLRDAPIRITVPMEIQMLIFEALFLDQNERYIPHPTLTVSKQIREICLFMIWSRFQLRINFSSRSDSPSVWAADVSYTFRDPVWPEPEDGDAIEYHRSDFYGDKGFRNNPDAIALLSRVKSIMFHGWSDWTEPRYFTEYWSIVRLQRVESTGEFSETELGMHIVDDDDEMLWENEEQEFRRPRAQDEIESIDAISVELLEKIVDGLTREELYLF